MPKAPPLPFDAMFKRDEPKRAPKARMEITDADWSMAMEEAAQPQVEGLGALEGLVGDVARYIRDAGQSRSATAALALAFPFCGTLFGRAYDRGGLRTNIYSVVLARSGMGKTSTVRPLRDLMIASKTVELEGPSEIMSASGLRQALTGGDPRALCLIDEFGHFVSSLTSAKAGLHQKAIMTEFTKMFSSAATVVMPPAYSDGRGGRIDEPNLSIFGMSTHGQFWQSFGSGNLVDGSLARFLVFDAEEEDHEQEPDMSQLQAVAREIEGALSVRPRGHLPSQDKVLQVPMEGPQAEGILRDLKARQKAFARYCEDADIPGAPAIFMRLAEHAVKLAMIHAIGRNPSSPEIDGQDMMIGGALSWGSCIRACAGIRDWRSESLAEEQRSILLAAIRKSTGPDGWATRSAVTRASRKLSVKERDAAMKQLEGEELVEMDRHHAGGRPLIRYRIL